MKKQACFGPKTYQKKFPVCFLFVFGVGEKLENMCFQKVVEDAETAEMRIFEVPKSSSLQTKIAKVSIPLVKRLKKSILELLSTLVRTIV